MCFVKENKWDLEILASFSSEFIGGARDYFHLHFCMDSICSGRELEILGQIMPQSWQIDNNGINPSGTGKEKGGRWKSFFFTKTLQFLLLLVFFLMEIINFFSEVCLAFIY